MAIAARRPAVSAQRDLTTGSLPRLLVTLALPAAAEMALFSVMGLIHAYWMGRVDEMALASVAMGTTLRMVLISPMMGLSAGGMALVARHVGARDTRRADHAVMQTILLLLLIVTAITTVGQLFLPTFLMWMGAHGEVFDGAKAYLRIVFGGLLFMEMLPTMNGVIRGAGHPEYTLRINLVYVAVMMLLEPILVLGLGPFEPLGVRGAAWAAVLGSASGVAAQMITLARGKAGVRLHLADVRPDLGVWRRILRIAVSTSAQRFSPNLANGMLMRLVSSLGDETLAAYSLVTSIYGFMQATTMGIGNATASLVGQNLGAKSPDRSQAATRLSVVFAVGSSLLFGALLNVGAGPVLGLFGAPTAVLAIAALAMRLLIFVGMGQAWMDVVGRALAGAGDAISPMLVNMGALWLVQLPAALLFSRALGLGPSGLWLGMAVSYVVGGAAMTLRFRTGRWKTIVV